MSKSAVNKRKQTDARQTRAVPPRRVPDDTLDAMRMLYVVYNDAEAPDRGIFEFDLGNVNMNRVLTRIEVVDKSMGE